jgi:hypothetical protein
MKVGATPRTHYESIRKERLGNPLVLFGLLPQLFLRRTWLMRKILPGILFPAFFLLADLAWAVPPCPALQPVYISSSSQILCVETATGPMQGQITVLVTRAASNFGDVAFGPDGLLYFTDSLGGIFRLDPKSGAAAALFVASIPTGTPAGLAFNSSNGITNGDLYVNASTGVWLISGIASSVSPAILPVTPTKVITFPSSIAAGGNAFDVFGPGESETQVIVDQTDNQILQSAFPFTNNAKSLANVSSLGKGIFANFCGDALVASSTAIQRLSFGFVNGSFVVTQSRSYVDFGKGNTVQYFEVTADNTVLAATFASGAGGIVWKVQPVKDPITGVPSCSATPTTTQIASLKSALQAKNPPDLLSDVATGVAVGPTSITITEHFDSTHPSQLYDFGFHRLFVTYEQVVKPFSQSFTAVQSLQDHISFSSPPFQPKTVPMHFAPLGGLAIQYVTPDPPPPNCQENPGDYDFGPCPPDDSAIQMRSAFSTQDFLLEPGMAHAPGDVLLDAPSSQVTYTQDLTHDFWDADQTDGLDSSTWSTYLVDNQTLKQNLMVIINSPVASCGATTTPTCNPQFKIGQAVDLKFTLSPSTSLAATARLSIALVTLAADGTVQIVQTIDVFSKNNADFDNFFNVNPSLNQYTYDWDSSGAAAAGPGLYQATIFSDSFEPQKVYLTLVK